jgi:hypothetical protein
MRTVLRLTLSALLVLALAPGLLWGQGAASAGTITGRITDATGGVVPGATVTITDASTKGSRTATTNKEGLFVFVNLPPATTTSRAEGSGDRTAAEKSKPIWIPEQAKPCSAILASPVWSRMSYSTSMLSATLHAWVVMPNPVHGLFTPEAGFTLVGNLHSWKSFTPKEANRLLSRSGQFWQEEYFDH